MNKVILRKIKRDGQTRLQASLTIGISTQTLYNAINEKPLGRKASKKISEWLGGKQSIAYLMKVK